MEFLTGSHLHLEAAAPPAGEWKRPDLRLRAAGVAGDHDRHLVDDELRTLDRRTHRDELERERERVDHDLAQPSHRELDARDTAPLRVPLRDRDDCLGEGELVHQQILGSGSPTSMSITRRPPNAVSTSTSPGGSLLTTPISAACSQPPAARRATRAASAASGATNATSTPSF